MAKPAELPSERGLLALAGDAKLPLLPREALVKFRELVSEDMKWADSRKDRFRRRAARLRVCALVLTAGSTVVLGIPAIPHRAAVALPLVAIVTLLGGLDAYFNWRQLWVLMEEAQYRLNRIRDDIDLLLVAGPEEDINRQALGEFFQRQQAVWAEVSQKWIQFRRTADPQVEPPSANASE